MSQASESYARLHEAMLQTDPACQGDDRFVRDDQSAEELQPICDACPLLTLCSEYAKTAKPAGGVWAGWRKGKPRRKVKSA